MIQIVIGSLLLSIVHPLIPSHWIPLVVISRAEKWSWAETLWVTVLAGGAHTLSTVLIGSLIGLVGYRLSSSSEFVTGVAAPLILAALGIIYLIRDLRKSHHHHDRLHIESVAKKPKRLIIVPLCIEMFFSPCLEIEAFYFTAGTQGFIGVVVVSIIYVVVTLCGMVALVHLGLKGVEKLKWHYLEHHPRQVTGLVLIVLGIFTYFVRI